MNPEGILTVTGTIGLIIVLIPLVLLLLIFIALFVVCLYLLSECTFFLGPSLFLLGIFAIINMIVVKLFHAVINHKEFKSPKWILPASIVCIIAGTAVTMGAVSKVETIKLDFFNQTNLYNSYEYLDNISFYNNYENLEFYYTIDNTVDDVELSIDYDNNIYDVEVLSEGNNHYIEIDDSITKSKLNYLYHQYMNYIKDNKVISNFPRGIRITIIANESNISSIIKNQSNVKHVTEYFSTNEGYKVSFGTNIEDNEECNLNEYNYYECKTKEESN